MGKQLVILIGVLAAVASWGIVMIGAGDLLQLSSEATPQPTSSPRVGDLITRGNWSYVVDRVELRRTVQWTDSGGKLDAVGMWLVVNVGVQNIGKESYSLNPWDFDARDDAGNSYKVNSLSSAFSASAGLARPGDSFQPGAPAVLGLLFDVRPTAKGLRLWLLKAGVEVDLGPIPTPAPLPPPPPTPPQ